MLDDVKDILWKVSHDGDDKYEKVSDDAKDILRTYLTYLKNILMMT